MGTNRGVGICGADAVDWIEEADAECEWRARFELLRFEVERDVKFRLRFETELEADASWVKIGGDGGFDCSCPTHQSHNTHPTNVPIEPHPTTAPGETPFV